MRIHPVLGLSNPASLCPAIFICTKPDSLGRGSSAATSGTRNLLGEVFFPRSSQASHACAEDVWPWLHRTWVPSTGGTWCQIKPQLPRAPSLVIPPTHPPKGSATLNCCCQDTWASTRIQQVSSPGLAQALNCPHPKVSLRKEIKQYLYRCWRVCIVCQMVSLNLVSDKSFCCPASTKTP